MVGQLWCQNSILAKDGYQDSFINYKFIQVQKKLEHFWENKYIGK